MYLRIALLANFRSSEIEGPCQLEQGLGHRMLKINGDYETTFVSI